MIFLVSITPQGRVTIPAKIRKQLGLFKGSKVIISHEKGKMIIEPVKII